MKKQIINCIYCNNKEVIKKGKRKNKNQSIQVYYCKDCEKKFTFQKQRNKTYSSKIINSAISLYNLGYSLNETTTKINNRFKTTISITTISYWLKQNKEICTYSRLRKEVNKMYNPGIIIYKKPLQHRQVYLFKYHKGKLDLLQKTNNKALQKENLRIKQYLERITTKDFPHHIFKNYEEQQRASQLNFKTLKFIKKEKNNFANKLAKLALGNVIKNSKRHEAIQEFMLVNDSSTIAIEIPIYLTKNDVRYFKERNFNINFNKTPITGHIDLLQVRNNYIHILDYKPEASKIKPIEQLIMYALALASRTRLPLNRFKCAWFDDNNYYEFFPLQGVRENYKGG